MPAEPATNKLTILKASLGCVNFAIPLREARFLLFEVGETYRQITIHYIEIDSELLVDLEDDDKLLPSFLGKRYDSDSLVIQVFDVFPDLLINVIG